MSDAKCNVRFEPMGTRVEVACNENLDEIAQQQQIPLRSDCGGLGLCGKCRVIAAPSQNCSDLTESELDVLSAAELTEDYRLACQVTIAGDLTVTIPDQLLDSEEVRGKTLSQTQFPNNSPVKRILLPKSGREAAAAAPSDDLVTVIAKRADTGGDGPLRFRQLHALRQLSTASIDDQDLTLIHHAHKGVTGVLPGLDDQSLGVAIDIGTTTLAAYLCDLKTGALLASAASVNPQRRHGEDVISRISLADEDPSGLQNLHEMVVSGINHLISRCLAQVGAPSRNIDEITLVGNTTMERLLANIHPHGLGVSPYLPVQRPGLSMCAADVGLTGNPGTHVYLFPVISGFVGGDSIGAMIADSIHLRDETCLIVDIGTNGELILGNRDRLWATSCATGPALEGAHISCGMRAVTGAICKVDLSSPSDAPACQILTGDDTLPPLGICGSGIIDAVAALRRCGILLPSGRFKEGMPGVVCDSGGIGREFVLVPADKAGAGRNISITLNDVRQIQLAKAALAVGIEYLMQHAKVSRIDRTVLTGAFGAKFDWRNAVDIGMLPPEAVAGEVLALENLAGVGAIMALLDQQKREEAEMLSERTRFVELAMEADFTMRFAEATVFPTLTS